MPKNKSIITGIIFFVVACLIILFSGFSPMWFPTQEDHAPGQNGLGPIVNNYLLKQSFTLERDWLYGIDIMLSNNGGYRSLENVILITDTNNNILASTRFSSDIITDLDYYSFRFNKNKLIGKGKKCNLIIYSTNGDQKSSVGLGILISKKFSPFLAIPFQNNDVLNSLKTPGQSFSKSICFRTYESNFGSFSVWQIPLYLLAFLFALVIIFFDRVRSWLLGVKIYPERIYLSLALVSGILLVFLTPPLQVPDENYHFYRAYQISELNISQFNKTIPKSLITLYDTLSRMNFQPVEKTSLDELVSLTKIKLEPKARTTLAIPGYYFPYFPQALGIFIGRLFNCSPILLVYIGRIFNLLFSVLIVFLAIRITPLFKWIFFLLGLMPMTMFLFASLSKDGLTISLCFLWISFFLQLAFDNEKKIKTVDLVFLYVISCFMALTRPIYLIILIMFLLIPVNKIGSVKKYIALLLGLIISVFLTPQIITILGSVKTTAQELPVSASQRTDAPTSSDHSKPFDRTKAAEGADPTAQKTFILNNPGQYLIIVFKSTFIYMRTVNLDSFVGILGWMTRPVPKWLINLYLWVLLFTALIISNENKKLGLKNRILIVFIFIGGILLVETGQYLGWTSVGQKFVAGVQGRYYIPYAPAFLLLFYNNFIYKNLMLLLSPRKKKQLKQKQKVKIIPIIASKTEIPVIFTKSLYLLIVCFSVVSLICTLYVVLTDYYVV